MLKSYRFTNLFFLRSHKKKLTGYPYGSYFAGGLPAETKNTPLKTKTTYIRVIQ